MVSQKKIAANRRNAKKSTGPKTARGKALTRFNALRYGIYAAHTFLPGEDEKAYQDLASRVAEECRPVGIIEEMLAQQIVRDMWRLRRLELAEGAHIDKVWQARLERLGSTFSLRELKWLKNFIDDGGIAPDWRISSGDITTDFVNSTFMALVDVPAELTQEEETKIRKRFDELFKLDSLLLEATVGQIETNALAQIERMRSKITREILKNYSTLEIIQNRRLTISAELKNSPN